MLYPQDSCYKCWDTEQIWQQSVLFICITSGTFSNATHPFYLLSDWFRTQLFIYWRQNLQDGYDCNSYLLDFILSLIDNNFLYSPTVTPFLFSYFPGILSQLFFFFCHKWRNSIILRDFGNVQNSQMSFTDILHSPCRHCHSKMRWNPKPFFFFRVQLLNVLGCCPWTTIQTARIN